MRAKRVLLIGAGGKTGASYARLLQAHGYHVLWYDKNPSAKPQGLDAKRLTHVPHDGLIFERLREQFDFLTLTPGVPLALPFIQSARSAGLPVMSEVAYSAPHLTGFKIIGITGTDGKSTTTTFVAQLLNGLGFPAMECGNFGIPLAEVALNREKYAGKILACELSSYQLEEPGALALDAAIFLNLAPDHLNRYPTVEDYGLAKWNILKLVRKGGIAVVARELMPGETTFWKNRHPIAAFANPVVIVDTKNLVSPHFSAVDGMLSRTNESRSLLNLAETRIAGRHNFSNLLFALEAVSALLGPPEDLKLAAALKSIVPLAHRFETIPQRVFPQMTFINDSKATTTQAASIALANAKDPVFIFLGGQGKGERYEDFGRLLKSRKAKALIYGECRTDMAADFRSVGFENFTLHENLFKAFHAAKRMVLQQNLLHATLLLSPAVTSWDQFGSFEERGDYFRSLVESLA